MTLAAQLALQLMGDSSISLYRTTFASPRRAEKLECVRAKSAGSLIGFGTFQWTSAVRALTCLALRHAAQIESKPALESCLIGNKGSLASSLDYAISKEPIWLCEMFGQDAKGNSFAKRLILRTNSNQKLPGPVILRFNPNILPPEAIHILLDGRPIIGEGKLHKILAVLERNPNVTFAGPALVAA